MNDPDPAVTVSGHPSPGQYRIAKAMGEWSLHIPRPVAYDGNPVIEGSPDQDFPDGARFISVMPTKGVLPDPLDQFYAYVGSHDGKEIWLATAPHPLGPWQWRTCILKLEDTSFVGHLSSPSAVFHDGQVYLYFHGVLPTGQQPTALATSTDGLTFTEHKFPVIFTHPNRQNSWYGQSTSYARIVKDGALFIATFQGNGLGYNVQVGGVTTAAGLAMSEDGIRWRVAKRPLMGNACGSRGPFAPILTSLWGRWLMLFERKGQHDIGGAVSLGSDVMGPYEDIGAVVPARPGIRNTGWPFPVFLGHHLYLLYGAQTGKQGAIYASVVDWRDGL